MASLPPSLGGPLAPDVVTYNSLLTALAARGETLAAERLVEEMVAGGGGLVSGVWLVLVWGCGGVCLFFVRYSFPFLSHPPHVRTHTRPPASSKPPPNVVTFNILIDHYSGLGQWEECRRTLQERMRAVR